MPSSRPLSRHRPDVGFALARAVALCHDSATHPWTGAADMFGCLIAGLLMILLFVLVPLPLWPFLVVGLVVLVVIAAALGLLKGILATIFRR